MSNTHWSEEYFLRPAFVSDAVWQQIYTNFLAHVGDPTGNLSSALQDDIDRLAGMGISQPSDLTALLFEFEQAGDFGSLAERASIGSVGQGWSSLSDIKLLIAADGSTSVTGLVDAGLLGTLDATQTAQYAVSLSLGKTIDQNGRLIESGDFARPSFTTNQNVDGDMTLIAVSGGYEMVADGGEKFVFDQFGKLVSFVSDTGETITVIYDVNDRLSRYQNATGGFLEFTYDVNGRVISVEDGNGRIVSYSYSANGELIDIGDDAGDTDFTYDVEGNLLTAQRVGGPALTFAYDAEGRLSSQNIGGLVSENYAYDNAGAITATNGLGEVTVIQIGPGGSVTGVANNLGQSFTMTADVGTNTVTMNSPDGTQSILTYNTAGDLQSVADGNGDVISFGYDSATGRIISFTDGGGGVREFDYDTAGRLLNADWSDNTSLNFVYDVQGDLTDFTNRRGETVGYGYDAGGNVTSVSDSASGALSYTYDVRGNVTSVTTPAGVTDITYDSAGRTTLIEYPNGRSLAYTYDAEGKRLSMINQDGEGTFYTYDAAGRLATIADDNGVLTSYSYDAAGRLLLETNGNGTYTEYDYDTAGRLDGITNYDSSASVNSFYQYSFDAAGRKTGAVTNDGSWTYGYDNAGQLTNADFTSTTTGIPSTSLEYQYDSAGNRIATIENGVTTNYASNGLNQYTTAGGKSFTYDDDGNLTAQTATGDNYSYVYDVDNRLIGVTKPDGTVISYEYDAFGNRSAIVEGGVRTEFLVDPFGFGNVIAEYDGLGARIASYAHGLGLASRTDASGTLSFFDVDATGSVVGLTNTTGGLANNYVYTPFGDELYESETILNSFEFNGAFGVVEDAENLLYMRARSYDVELGRFLSEDPLFLNGDTSNLYRFSYNDPVQYADPEGDLAFLIAVAFGAYPAGVLLPFAAEAYDNRANPEHLKALGQEFGPALAAITLAPLGAATNTSKIISGAQLLNELVPEAGGGDGGRTPGGPIFPEYRDWLLPPPLDRPDGAWRDFWRKAVQLISPLVLDLDESGTIDLLSLENSISFFDLDGDGMAERSGWVSSGDGLLAIDLNSDGVINDISELFGNGITDGFTELAAHDSNADGKINISDTVWGDLLVWQDANENGYSEDTELHTLDVFNIVEFDLAGVVELSNPQDNQGNEVSHTGTYLTDDGGGAVSNIVHDVWFELDQVQSRFVEPTTVDVRTLFLPNLRGYGNLKDLYLSMSDDNTGIDNLLDQVATLDVLSFEGLFEGSLDADIEAILYRWAGVDPLLVTNARGIYLDDAKHLEFLEEMFGEEFLQRGFISDPRPQAADEIEKLWALVFQSFKSHLVFQAGADALFAATDVTYNLTNGQVESTTFDLDQTSITALKDHALTLTQGERVDFWTNIGFFVENTKGDVIDVTELGWLDTAVADSLITGVLDWADVVALTVAPGSYNEIDGDATANTLNGTVGNDEIYGLAGNDAIDGGDGHDRILGGDGDDILTGGNGSDTIEGGAGHDTYNYTIGFDAYSEFTHNTGSLDTLVMGAGIFASDISFFRTAANDLYVTVDGKGEIQIEEHFVYPIETLTFVEAGQGTIDLTNLNDLITHGTDDSENITGIAAGNQNDIIYGYAGNDDINASDGDDTVYAGDDHDDVDGGDGNDTLYGGAGNDTILGQNDNDQIWGDAGNDIIDGGAGLDTIYGGDDNDNIEGGTGNDTIYGGAGDDVIEGQNDNDTIYGDAGADDINGGLGDDIIEGGTEDDVLDGHSGIDQLSGGDGNDTLIGGAGDDTLDGDDGDDVLRGDAGLDTLNGGIGNDLLEGGDKDDIINGGTGIDTVTYENAIASVVVDLSAGTAADDGYFDSDTLSNIENVKGSDNNDTITGDTGDNALEGWLGDDALNGGAGDDEYIFNAGDGQDTITDTSGLYDFVRLGVGIAQADVVLTQVGNNLEITFTGTPGDKITVVDHYDTGTTKQVEKLIFDDLSELHLVLIQGTSGNDTLTGTAGDDIFIGSDGNDSIDGLAGIDMVSYENASAAVSIRLNLGTVTGQGSDTVTSIENATGSDYNDTLQGTTGANTLYGGDGNDTILSFAGDDILYGGAGNDTFNASGGNDILYGEDGNDTLRGYNNDDMLDGGAGDDTLYAGNDNDILVGGLGKDTVYGENGDDILYDVTASDSALADPTVDTNYENFKGGAGNDLIIHQAGWDNLYGETGDDVYKIYSYSTVVNRSTVTDTSGNDKIILASTNYTDVGWEFWTPGGAELRVNYDQTGSTGYIRIVNQFSGYDASGVMQLAVETFEFADATSIDFRNDYMIEGTTAAETLNGTSGNDFIFSSHGGDTINAGDGNDYAKGGDDADTLNGDGGDDKLYGHGGDDTLNGGAGNDTLDGEAGDDILYGGDGNDILRDSSGNNILYGGAGNDTMSSVTASTVAYGEEGDDYITGNSQDNVLYGDGDGTEIYAGGVDTVIGGSGNDTLYGGGGNDLLRGDRGDDILYGGDGDDYMDGEKNSAPSSWTGNDTLYGGNGNDSMRGENGDDILYGEADNDSLSGQNGNDALYGGDGLDNLWGGAGADTFVFESASAFNNSDNINDFNVGDGDSIDVSDLLIGYDPLTDAIEDFVHITSNGSSSFLRVDADGGANNFIQIAAIGGVTGLSDEEALETSGNLITV